MSTQVRLRDDTLPAYLRERGLVAPAEEVAVSPAGDGNINWVRRATVKGSEQRSYVVKQARPALERFPEYEVSTERIVFEARWLEVARAYDEAGLCPRVHAFDEPNRVLILEDLGEVERLDEALRAWASGELEASAPGEGLGGVAAGLAAFLGRVHRETSGHPLAGRFANDAMRRLHGEHIFELPYGPDGFELPAPLATEAERLRNDAGFRDITRSSYLRYLEPRGALLHGDVQGGNVLLPPEGPKLLDAEIAHVGDPAFDLGVLSAHLVVSAVARGEGERARPLLDAAARAYTEARGLQGAPDVLAACRYAGLELLRRTLGAARLPEVAEPTAGLRVAAIGEAWARTPAPPVDAPL